MRFISLAVLAIVLASTAQAGPTEERIYQIAAEKLAKSTPVHLADIVGRIRLHGDCARMTDSWSSSPASFRYWEGAKFELERSDDPFTGVAFVSLRYDDTRFRLADLPDKNVLGYCHRNESSSFSSYWYGHYIEIRKYQEYWIVYHYDSSEIIPKHTTICWAPR